MSIEIYNEECLKGLKRIPDNSVDLVLTDPPYGLNYNDGDLANKWESAFGGDKTKEKSRPIANDSEEIANDNFKKMLIEAKRILRKGCCCCCCGGGGGKKPLFARWTLWMDEIIGFNHAVVWDKGGLGMGLHWRRSYEFMLIAQNGDPLYRWNGGRITSNILRLPKIIPTAEHHPTQKPVELMKYFIKLFTDEGDLICDPFFGSGTTAIACKELNRNFIGFEIEKKYYDIAMSRIQHTEECIFKSVK